MTLYKDPTHYPDTIRVILKAFLDTFDADDRPAAVEILHERVKLTKARDFSHLIADVLSVPGVWDSASRQVEDLDLKFRELTSSEAIQIMEILLQNWELD